jgi:hypothetical protein
MMNSEQGKSKIENHKSQLVNSVISQCFAPPISCHPVCMESTNKKPRCHHISKIGSRCMADPQTGKNYCFFHDPEQKKKQAEARKQGGETRSRQTEPEIKLPRNLPVVPLEKFSDVLDLLGQTINHLFSGEMDVAAARAIGYLAGLLQRSLKAGAQPIATRLADTINRFRRGEMDLRTAKTIGHLSALMLNALKQQAQQQMAEMMAAANEPSQPPQTNRQQAPRLDRIETAVTPIAAAQAQDDQNYKVHPAIINGNAGNTRDHGGRQTA